MNKARIETISDGVFSIVMTLLVFDVKVPESVVSVSNTHLWAIIGALTPLLVSFVFSFAVLSVFWLNHHFLFHSFAKSVDRKLNLLNMLYLLFIVFVPFSAHLLGTYPSNQPAAVVYGLNILAIVWMSTVMLRYLLKHKELLHEGITKRIITQSKIRGALSLIFYTLGLFASFFYIPLSIGLYLFPIFFNLIPGTLDFVERTLNLDLG